MNLAAGMVSRTVCLGVCPPKTVQDGFPHDAAGGSSGGQKQEIQFLRASWVEARGGDTASAHLEAARVSAHGSGWPAQHSLVR